MELTTKGRYAVMAMVDLATNSALAAEPAKSVTLADIARRQEISQSYLEQLFARLRRHGLVDSTRGPGGGYRLAIPAEEIAIGAIMAAVEEPLQITRCEAHNRIGCRRGGRRCLTHDLWDELSRHIRSFLGALTLADVVSRQISQKTNQLSQFSLVAAQ
jgi:Rrf2 family iron-sulfur cluster assembly transcriptional regulator